MSKKEIALHTNVYGKGSLATRIWHNKYMYLLFLPAFIYFIIFCYVPMYGVTLAFKEFSYSRGILRSPWASENGMKHFISLTTNPQFALALKNTLVISLSRLIFEFPVPIILALLINEIRSSSYKRIVQTVYTFPHFISWIIVTGLFFNLFAHDGIVNQFRGIFGLPPSAILSNPDTFRSILYISSDWKESGWSAIIYLATITGISPELYEAAKIDGANRGQLVKYITWPCLKGTVALLFVLNVANLMNAGFDQIFNLSNPAVQDKVDIIDTLVYRLSFKIGTDFGFTTAIGLFKSVINFALLLGANTLVKRSTGKGIY